MFVDETRKGLQPPWSSFVVLSHWPPAYTHTPNQTCPHPEVADAGWAPSRVLPPSPIWERIVLAAELLRIQSGLEDRDRTIWLLHPRPNGKIQQGGREQAEEKGERRVPVSNPQPKRGQSRCCDPAPKEKQWDEVLLHHKCMLEQTHRFTRHRPWNKLHRTCKEQDLGGWEF